jgi:chromosome partitioning protein
MMILLIGGEKGGTGKTTLALNLAVLCALDNKDVLFLDTDRQGSANIWATTRAKEKLGPTITCISKFGEGLAEEVSRLASKFDDIIIDAGGRDTVELRQAMLAAEKQLIPARPSQFDIESLGKMDSLVRDCRGFNPRLQALVVINCAPTNPNMSDVEDMSDVLEDLSALTLLSSVVRDRVAFRRSIVDGKGVVEMTPGDEKAVFEITKLYKEVFNG